MGHSPGHESSFLSLILTIANASALASENQDLACDAVLSPIQTHLLHEAAERARTIIAKQIPEIQSGRRSVQQLVQDVATEIYLSGVATLFDKPETIEAAQLFVKLEIDHFNEAQRQAILQEAINQSKVKPIQIRLDFSAGYCSFVSRFWEWKAISREAKWLNIEIVSRTDGPHSKEMIFEVKFSSWKSLQSFFRFLISHYKPKWSRHPEQAKDLLRKQLQQSRDEHPLYDKADTIALPESAEKIDTKRVHPFEF